MILILSSSFVDSTTRIQNITSVESAKHTLNTTFHSSAYDRAILTDDQGKGVVEEFVRSKGLRFKGIWRVSRRINGVAKIKAHGPKAIKNTIFKFHCDNWDQLFEVSSKLEEIGFKFQDIEEYNKDLKTWFKVTGFRGESSK